MKKLILIFWILFLIQLNLNASQDQMTDARHYTNNPEIFNEYSVSELCDIASGYYRTNIDTALFIVQNAMNKAKAKNDPSDLAIAHSSLGNCYYFKSRFDSSIVHLELSKKYYLKIKDYSELMKIYNRLGILYRNISNYSKSISYFNKIFDLFEQGHGDSVILSAAYSNMSTVYNRMGDYPKALSLLFECLKISEKQEDSLRYLAPNYNNLGIVFQSQADFDNAYKYYNKALSIRLNSGDSSLVAESYNNIGNVFYEKKDYENALKFYFKVIDILEKMPNSRVLSITTGNIANIYFMTNEYDSSLHYNYISLEIRKQINDLFGQAQSYENLAFNYLELANTEKALEFANKSLEIAFDINAKPNIRSTYHLLSRIYEAKNDYKQAFEMLKNYEIYNDSIFNMNAQAEINQLKLIREEAQNQRLEDQSKIDKQQIFQQKLISFGLLFLAFMFMAFTALSLKANRSKKLINKELESKSKQLSLQNLEIKKQTDLLMSQKEQLSRLNDIKSKVFTIISHDLRNLLHSTKSVFDLKNKNLISDKDFNELIPELTINMDHVSELFENLMSWSYNQMNGKKANQISINLNDLIVDNVRVTKNQAVKKQISIINNLEDQLLVNGDAEMIKLVIRNLLINAIKFTPIKGEVKIDAENNEKFTTITIEDNGIGMNENQLNLLFTAKSISTSGTQNEKGSGIGLYLCKEYIELNKGKIWAESKPGVGSKFIFTLPLKKDVLANSQ